MSQATERARIEQASAWCLRQAEGPLTTDERQRFERWLSEDPAHVRAFESAAGAWHAFGQAGAEPELIGLRHEALEHLRRAQSARWRQVRQPWRAAWLGVAATLVLSLLGAMFWLQSLPQRYETGLGERQLVRLQDGSQLSIDADSRVEVRYGSDRREVWLRQGRARFQVARDPLRPFSVSAADKVVVATGTEFSVELVASQMHVILYEGSVEVLNRREGRIEPLSPPVDRSSRSAPAPAAAARLTPGRELVARLDRPEVRLREIDVARARTWESGQLVFNDEPLAAAIERLNRYGKESVRLGDERLGAIRISGTYSAGDTAAFIEGITGVFAVRAEHRAGEIVLTSAR